MALLTELGRGGSKAKAEIGKMGSVGAGRGWGSISERVLPSLPGLLWFLGPVFPAMNRLGYCRSSAGLGRGAGVAPRRGMLWGCSFPWAEAARLPSDSPSATGKAGDEPSPPRWRGMAEGGVRVFGVSGTPFGVRCGGERGSGGVAWLDPRLYSPGIQRHGCGLAVSAPFGCV